MKSIVLITSGQPSLNPRLVKEADTLIEAGYNVTVIYQYWNDWGTEIDKILLPPKKWKAIRVGGSPDDEKFSYWMSRMIYKAGQALSKVSGSSQRFAEINIGRCTSLLTAEALKHKADLYIAHNLAALPVAVKASKKYSAKCAFDAEDFHRNEVSNDVNDKDVILKSHIEQKYIPQVNYVTASSPGIAAAYKSLFAGINPIVLLNAFPIDHTISSPLPNDDKQLRLFWFSQTIGPKRGIEDVVQALTLLNNPEIELHLLGDLPPTANTYLTKIGVEAINLHVHQPISPDQINQLASQFDIGLALETGFCVNNDLALSNKIFTYMQAGLAIIASDTSAQKELLNAYPETGIVYEKGNVQMLTKTIDHYYRNKTDLHKAKTAAYKAARNDLNWETESVKFLNLVADILQA